MADGAAPLLPSNSGERTGISPESNDPSFNKKKTPANFINDAIERYMDVAAGPTHLLLPTLAAFAWFFDAQQAFISIFSDSSPPWHCTTSACTTSITPCNFPYSSWSYSLPRHISTISDFSLYCASPVLLGLPASSFFGGLLLATIADSQLGRKKNPRPNNPFHVHSLRSHRLLPQRRRLRHPPLRLRLRPSQHRHLRLRPLLRTRPSPPPRPNQHHQLLLLHHRLPLPTRHCFRKQNLILEIPLPLHFNPMLFLQHHRPFLNERIPSLASRKRKNGRSHRNT
ncbi:hypothetical protein M5K25_002249 [Dendrobium thyrsiflorum]|uniref:Uncharacterized protein n=1 Tax=Dendrobium thyrsiflorum TaxID=117978 RepID=A0ABD0W1X1_DENTH